MAARFDELSPYLEAFDNKLSSLARTNSALLHNHWSAMDVHAIVQSECSPFLDLHDEAVVVEGPNLRVEGRNAAMLGLAIHELATNAAKHGALSDGAGTVQVEFDGQDGAGLSHFLWRERGGPKVSRGDRTGFGSVLLEEIVPDALGLEAEIAFDEDGVTYRLGAHTR
jgi:two-component sensor histidine kinase